MTNRREVAPVNVLLRGTARKSNTYIETLRCLNALLRQLRPTTTVYELLRHRDNAQPHTSVPPTKAITNFDEEWCRTQPTLLNSQRPVIIGLSFKIKSVRVPLCQWRCTAERHATVAAEGGEKHLWARTNVLAQRWKKSVDKNRD